MTLSLVHNTSTTISSHKLIIVYNIHVTYVCRTQRTMLKSGSFPHVLVTMRAQAHFRMYWLLCVHRLVYPEQTRTRNLTHHNDNSLLEFSNGHFIEIQQMPKVFFVVALAFAFVHCEWVHVTVTQAMCFTEHIMSISSCSAQLVNITRT